MTTQMIVCIDPTLKNKVSDMGIKILHPKEFLQPLGG